MVVICPRCGQEGYVEILRRPSERSYLYVTHIVVEDGKKRRKKHYIGPVGGYENVEMFLDLGLRSFHEIDYLEIALKAVRRIVEKAVETCSSGDPRCGEKRAEALKKLETLSQRIDDLKRKVIEIGTE